MKKPARPFVTANFALTCDGRISTRNSTPAHFTSKADKRRLLEIRAGCDAILASARTIATDRMTMGLPAEDLRAARLARGQPAHPLRVLLTNSGRISPALPVFARDTSPIVIFSTTAMPQRTRAALAAVADVWLYDRPAVDLPDMLATLRREYRVRRIVCEGGAQIFRALLTAGLIDDIHITIAPRIFGGMKAPTLTGLAGDFLPHSVPLVLKKMQFVNGECFLRYGRMKSLTAAPVVKSIGC